MAGLALIFIHCAPAAAQKEVDCLEQLLQSDPYRTYFDSLEQSLLQSGSLQDTSGQAYRQLAEEALRQNDLSILMPVSIPLEAIQMPYPCIAEMESHSNALLLKLIPVMDTLESAGDLSPALITGAFLNAYGEKDWKTR